MAQRDTPLATPSTQTLSGAKTPDRVPEAGTYPSFEESLMADIDILVGSVYGSAMLVAETLRDHLQARRGMSASSSTKQS